MVHLKLSVNKWFKGYNLLKTALRFWFKSNKIILLSTEDSNSIQLKGNSILLST